MENLKNYKSIKDYLNKIQNQKLEQIIEVILIDSKINNTDLMTKTKERTITNARRKIAYIARLMYNVEGRIISKRLNLQAEQVWNLIYSTFNICQVEADYANDIKELINKINGNN